MSVAAIAPIAQLYQQFGPAQAKPPLRSPADNIQHLDAYLGSGWLDLAGMMDTAAYGRVLLAEYLAQEIPAPKWLEPNLARLAREIKTRYRREQERRLAAAEKELEELRSKEERRASKEKEIEALRHELGL